MNPVQTPVDKMMIKNKVHARKKEILPTGKEISERHVETEVKPMWMIKAKIIKKRK